MLFLHRSNRMERLVDALGEVVREPSSDPFAPEPIAVPSPGMERWLSMELCRRLGVWAQPAFPFPKKLVEQLFAAVLGDQSELATRYDPACMAFTLATLLAEHEGKPEFGAVAHYMEGDTHARRRLALAQRLAELFDQYATYRPELVLGWQEGREQHFQAQLFRRLVQESGPGHVAARAAAFVAVLAKPAFDPRAAALPERVSVFGISTLPPLYLDLLQAVSKHVAVHLYLLSPTREFYADLRSRAQRDARLAQPQLGLMFEAEHWSASHPLLASLGRHSRELSEVLEERTTYAESSDELYEDPGEQTLLTLLQSDMLALRDRGHDPEAPRVVLAPHDTSIAIHACHGPMREIEVLHDQLLALFEDPEIEPHDVIVMMPDIEAYAPMIDAVFGSDPALRARIPFRIADRGALRRFEVVSALNAVLDLFGSRMGASQVLDLLGSELLRARFGITADEVELAREMCVDAGVRWGIDAEHRAEVGQPARSENTWRFGLERLALGYALPDDAAGSSTLFMERAPQPIDSERAALLGRLSEFCAKLFALHAECRGAHTLASWQDKISRVLRDLIAERAQSAEERKLCQRAMAHVVETAQRAGWDEPVELSTLRSLLNGAIDTRAPAQSFLAGGVTFCQLVPMRSIPFQVVCLIGMSDGAFPASDTPLGFDKIAERPRKGDRSRRNDDRQLFLEALLSARKKLLISYVGQGIHDGKPRPPSVLVSELVDHVAQSCSLPDEPAEVGSFEHAGNIEKRLLVRHPLAPWSPRYFSDEASPTGLFSFARGQYGGACALIAERASPRPFFVGSAVPPIEARGELQELPLAELEGFLERPVRFFVRSGLGVPLGNEAEAPEDREPLVLSALERWKVGDDLLARARRGSDDTLTLLRARGGLPLGTLGKLVHDDIDARARSLAAAAREHADGPSLPKQRFALAIAGVQLTGVLSELWPTAQVRVQYSKVGGRQELRLWLRHLVLALLRQHSKLELPATSVLVGRYESEKKDAPAVVRFEPIEAARARDLLAQLIAVHRTGQHTLIPLFEHASRAYAKARRNTKTDPADVLGKARDRFVSPYESFALTDSIDAYVSAAFPRWEDVLALRAPYDFETLAELVYGALLDHRRDK